MSTMHLNEHRYAELKGFIDERENCALGRPRPKISLDSLGNALIPGDAAGLCADDLDFEAITTTGNGDCLFNAVSLALIGDESLSEKLREATACELFLHAEFYANHPKLLECSENPKMMTHDMNNLFSLILCDEADKEFSKTQNKEETIRHEAIRTVTPRRWSGMLQIMGLSSAVGRRIYVLYPECNFGIRPLVHGLVAPRVASNDIPGVHILWSRDGNMDNTPNVAFEPNHFVYLHVKDSDWTYVPKRKRSPSTQRSPQKRRKQRAVQSKISDMFCKQSKTSVHNKNDSKSLQPDFATDEAPCSDMPSTAKTPLTPSSLPAETSPIDVSTESVSVPVCNINKSNIAVPARSEIYIPDENSSTDMSLNQGGNIPSTSKDCTDQSIVTFGTKPVVMMNDEMKYTLIQSRIPPQAFRFPSKTYSDKKKKSGVRLRSCQHQWFQQFDFITYSVKDDGLYCLPCTFFPKGGLRPKLLISEPYRNWKDAISDLKNHASCEYHKSSATVMQHFLKTQEDSSSRIDQILDKNIQAQVSNREILTSILKCIEFCGRQGIPLRSHRDDDKLNEDERSNMGNLKELLQLCAEIGDTDLQDHLQTCAKNAKYSSKTAQNELLNCMKVFMQQEIVKRVKNQEHIYAFGIQADEVTDVSNREQLGIVVRYLENGNPVERLIEYVVCEDISGEAISKKILQVMNDLGLDMEKCRSQSYDGAGNMAGSKKGCASRIKQRYPKAEYHYCMNHDLNLAVSKSCQLPEIKVMLDTCKQIGLVFQVFTKTTKET